ncbi:MAG: CPBP family intramembrane metalloprotease [Nitrospiraceae bacterium]|nr:CPBP family intramembrane metalloprotease [Nitrospiraceae bacterium]
MPKQKKAALSYCLLLAVAVLAHAAPSRPTFYLVPLFMLTVPVILGQKIRVALSMGHVATGLIVSAGILAPVFLILSAGKPYHFIGFAAVFSQLLRVAIPEEVFFRGFLQQTLGNNLRGILIVSLLFSVAHLPAFFFLHDASALLTFFPSLVMGYLYMRTSNVLPPVLFHLLANVVYQGFMI